MRGGKLAPPLDPEFEMDLRYKFGEFHWVVVGVDLTTKRRDQSPERRPNNLSCKSSSYSRKWRG